MTYSQIYWFPLCGGLALLGFIASWFAWRRRGVAAGLRGVAWSLLPLAAYLTRAVKMLWQIGSAIGSFATSLVLSPQVWLGVIVAGVSGLLFAVSGGLRRRRSAKAPPAGPAGLPAARPGTAVQPAKGRAGKGNSADDDEFGDVAQILRKHGIS